MLERMVELVERDEAAPEQIEQRTGVDRPGARRHRHALERREPHRGVDRLSVPDGRHGAAAAEMADDEPLRPHARSGHGHRETVEPVAPDPPVLSEPLRAARRWTRTAAWSRGTRCRTPRRAGRSAALRALSERRRPPGRCGAEPDRSAPPNGSRRRRRSRTARESSRPRGRCGERRRPRVRARPRSSEVAPRARRRRRATA